MTTATTLDQRKADILRLAQNAVQARGQRRRARHQSLLTLLLTAGVTVLAITMTPTRIAPSAPGPIAEAPPEPSAPIIRVATTAGLSRSLAATGEPTIARVRTDASRIARVETRPNAAGRLTDLQALALLREAGRPAGLIRIEGRVTLVYHRPPAPAGPASRARPEPSTVVLAAALIGRPYRPL